MSFRALLSYGTMGRYIQPNKTGRPMFNQAKLREGEPLDGEYRFWTASRLDALEASSLKAKMKYIDRWINQRIDNEKMCGDILLNAPRINAPAAPKNRKHTFYYPFSLHP